LKKIKNEISPELVARYSYERCLYYLFQLDISSVRKELNNWEINESLPYEAKELDYLLNWETLKLRKKY
jgi:ABC-type transport system involved in Fe-S cluster assembly fused permease/ATPase subunit